MVTGYLTVPERVTDVGPGPLVSDAGRADDGAVKARVVITIAVASMLVFAGGCGGSNNDDPQVPNPATVFCEEQGGATSGPEPMCELPDGSVVDAWEYYRTQGPGD